SVPEKISLAIGAAVLGFRKPDAFLGWTKAARQKLVPGMSSIDDAFELGSREKALADRPLGEVRHIVRHGSGDRAHRHGFDKCGGVLAGSIKRNTARPIGEIISYLIKERRRHVEPCVANRQHIVPNRCIIGSGLRSGAFHRSKERGARRSPGRQRSAYG